jgi:hypothetical protein
MMSGGWWLRGPVCASITWTEGLFSSVYEDSQAFIHFFGRGLAGGWSVRLAELKTIGQDSVHLKDTAATCPPKQHAGFPHGWNGENHRLGNCDALFRVSL